jgi:hypothetical protein
VQVDYGVLHDGSAQTGNGMFNGGGIEVQDEST